MKLNEIKQIFEAVSDSADTWLSKYTLENLDKYPSDAVVEELLSEYPYDGGTIYRGLNFQDKEQWEKFKEHTKNLTVLETGSISSWTPSKKEAFPFAITRPTYFLDRELMQAESTKNKNVDYMIGHVGVILKTTIGPNAAIDVRKSPHSKESEVILPAGVYKIEVDDKHIPFMRGITKENVKEQFMAISSIKNHTMDSKKFNHIMFHYKDFDIEMRKHLYTLVADSIDDIKFHVDISDDYDYDYDYGNYTDRIPGIDIGWNVPTTFFVYYAMLLPGDQQKADKIILQTLKLIDADFKQKLKDSGIDESKKFNVRINPSILMALKIERFEKSVSFLKYIRQLIGSRYNKLNSYASVKEINQIKDPKERQAAIEKMAKNILQTLSQFR